MTEITESFLQFHTRILELNQLLTTLAKRLTIASGHEIGLGISFKFGKLEQIKAIARFINEYKEIKQKYLNYFENDFQNVAKFIKLLEDNDFKPENRHEVLTTINEEIQSANEFIEQIKDISASECMKLLVKDRRDIDKYYSILEYFFVRYKYDIEKLAIKYSDLIYGVVERSHFLDSDGQYEELKALVFAKKTGFSELASIMEHAAKMLIPKEK